MWNWLIRTFSHETEVILDHIPVTTSVAESKIKKARKKAQERHGKEFHCDKIKPREVAPSETLLKLNAQTQKASQKESSNKITPIPARKTK